MGESRYVYLHCLEMSCSASCFGRFDSEKSFWKLCGLLTHSECDYTENSSAPVGNATPSVSNEFNGRGRSVHLLRYYADIVTADVPSFLRVMFYRGSSAIPNGSFVPLLMTDEWSTGLGETPVPVPLFPSKFHKECYETN